MSLRRRGGAAEFTRPSLLAAAALTFGTSMATGVLSLANVLVVSRALGPSGRGAVVFLMTVAALSSRLAAFGVQEANVNLGGSEPKARPALATNSVFLALGFGAAAAVMLEGLVALVPRAGGGISPELRWLALAAVPMLVLQVYLYRLAQADYRFTLTNVSLLVPPLLNVTVNGALALAGRISVGTAFGTWLGGQALSTGLLVWYVETRLAGFGRPSGALARRAVSFGVKSHLGRIMNIGNYRLDQWLLGSLAGTKELGLYSIAVAWSETLFSLPTALAIVQRPDLVRARRTEARRQSAFAFRVTAALTLPLALATVLLAPFLCVTVFGDEFRGSIDDLRVLVLGAFGIVALRVLGNALTAQGRPLLESVAIAAALVATVVFDVVLIPPYGGLGAAVASVIAYTVGGVVVAAVFLRVLGGRSADLLPRPREVVVLLRARLRPWRRTEMETALSAVSAEGEPPAAGP